MKRKSKIVRIGDIDVFCSFDELWPIEEFKAFPDNPNKHPSEQIARYADVFRVNGVRRAATVSRRSGFTTRGNGAIMAAKSLRMDRFPVDLQEYDDDDAERADVIADIRIPQLASVSEDDLKKVLLAMDTGSPFKTGFNDDELRDLLEGKAGGSAHKAELEISPELFERHDYIVVLFDNQLDWNVAVEKFGLKQVRNAKVGKSTFASKGLSRVIPASKLLELLK